MPQPQAWLQNHAWKYRSPNGVAAGDPADFLSNAGQVIKAGSVNFLVRLGRQG
jgi:hypothetical protein